jgi:hypothetical protein
MRTIEDFVIVVYCALDDALRAAFDPRQLRGTRGPAPRLTPAEVLTLLVVGESLGLDTEVAIWAHFRRHWRAWFPRLGSRAAFARQAANLWAVAQRLHAHFAAALGAPTAPVHVIDGAPLPVCRHGRAARCQRFRGAAARSWCDAKKEWYWGLKLHLVIDLDGTITTYDVTAASVDERDVAPTLLAGLPGHALADGGYHRRALREDLAAGGLVLVAPHHPRHRPVFGPTALARAKRARRIIETVLGQLVERFHLARVWARDAWHLTGRVARKVLAHTLLTTFARQYGLTPLEFAPLLAA